MRELTGHQINECNSNITITCDDLGHGGASHVYDVAITGKGASVSTRLSFQNGPIKEVGVNGITHEVLLAILVDRLTCFQAGPYASRENALALTKLQEAAHWLEHRTKARVARGVEGTHNV